MNVRLLATAAAIAAFGIAGAQAQTSTHGQMQQNDSVRGSTGAPGTARTQPVQPRGSTHGTVGAATGRSGVNAGTSGSVKTAPGGAAVDDDTRSGGAAR